MFILYNIIHRQKIAVRYSLLVMIKQWTETEKLIRNLTYTELISVTKEIKENNRYINPTILILKRQVQIVAVHAPHSYARCFQFRL